MPLEYINKERLKMAKTLLPEAQANTRSVCSQCGFSDVNCFTRVFKK